MRHLLSIIVFLLASVGYGKESTTETSNLVCQPMIENSIPSKNHLSKGLSNESIYIDQVKDTSSISPKSKPKPKRYALAKVVFYLLLATYCSYWLSIHQ